MAFCDYLENTFGHAPLKGSAQTGNLQVASMSCPLHVKGREKQSQRGANVVVGVHQGIVLSRLLALIIVLEASSREFHTGCSWELLYADDLVISAESIEELLIKLKTWKSEMEKKGLRVNIGKIKIMMTGINLDLLKKSGKDPCLSDWSR